MSICANALGSCESNCWAAKRSNRFGVIVGRRDSGGGEGDIL